MYSLNIIKALVLSIVFTGICIGQERERRIEKIVYSTDYKFDEKIQDKLIQDTIPWKSQVAASEYAQKGGYKNALIQWDITMTRRVESFTKNQIDSIQSNYTQVDATDYIVSQAKENQVVIINEAHHSSMHRVYGTKLLKALYAEGYRNLGLEALFYDDDLDSLQNVRKYPVLETGYYIKDPQFGNLVREAIAIGYTIFPYETQNREATPKEREIEQAKNIQQFIETKPDEKFLIYCGFGHVVEGNHEFWGKAMAGRLTEYTGIDPLTINQVKYSEKSKLELTHPLLKALEIIKPTVLVNKHNEALKYKQGETWADIAVFHPITEYINNRPHWLFENENKNVFIDLEAIDLNFPVMVLAFKKGEDINKAIPVDLTEVTSKTEDCHLGLKKGNYEIVVTDGKTSYKFKESVK